MYRIDNTLNIQIGEFCLSIKCLDKYSLDKLRITYSNFLNDKQPDITIELDTVENMSPEEVKLRVRNSEFFHRDGIFHFGDELVSGEYNLDSKVVRVSMEKQLLIQNYESYYLNQLVCLLYNSCLYINGVKIPGSHIVHSSAVVKDGYGMLFTGPSGIGKTTAAMIYGSQENTLIVNDEGNLISKPGVNGTQATLHGIPVIGKLEEHHNITAPLLCVFFLKQSNKTELRPLDRTDAFKRLLLQVVANVYFGQNDMKAILTSKADFSEEITRNIPCYELEFTLDSKLLNDILNSLLEKLINDSRLPCLIK